MLYPPPAKSAPVAAVKLRSGPEAKICDARCGAEDKGAWDDGWGQRGGKGDLSPQAIQLFVGDEPSHVGLWIIARP